MDCLDPTDIAEIEARLKNITPGPWVHGPERLPTLTAMGVLPHRHIGLLESVGIDGWRGNAEFICNAPTDIAALLEEVRRLRGAIHEIKQATIDGKVCDDVAWFSEIETLHDFCDATLNGLTP